MSRANRLLPCAPSVGTQSRVGASQATARAFVIGFALQGSKNCRVRTVDVALRGESGLTECVKDVQPAAAGWVLRVPAGRAESVADDGLMATEVVRSAGGAGLDASQMTLA